MKYFHGGQQDRRLEVTLLLAGGMVWSSLEAHLGLRQQPRGRHVHSGPAGSPRLACMLVPPLLGVWAANSSRLPLHQGLALC